MYQFADSEIVGTSNEWVDSGQTGIDVKVSDGVTIVQAQLFFDRDDIKHLAKMVGIEVVDNEK